MVKEFAMVIFQCVLCHIEAPVALADFVKGLRPVCCGDPMLQVSPTS